MASRSQIRRASSFIPCNPLFSQPVAHRRTLSVCTRQHYQYTATQWRCSLADPTDPPPNNGSQWNDIDSSDQHPMKTNPESDSSTSKDEIRGDGADMLETGLSSEMDGPQTEGFLASGSLDQGFEDVLSKDWDQLMNFDPENMPEEPIMEQDTTDSAIADSDEEESAVSGDDDPPADVKKKRTRKTKENAKTKAKTPTKGKGKANVKGKENEGIDGEGAEEGDEEEEEPLLKPKKRGRKPSKTKKSPKINEILEETAQLTEEEASLFKTPRWYFVQVKPGCENSVATSIRNLSQSVNGDDIVEVLVPTTMTLRLTKGGESIHKEERFFPGYILVLMIMNRLSYGHIQRVPNVQCFMGDPNREKRKDQPFRPPLPVSDSEMKKIFMRINKDPNEIDRAEVEMGFSLGDMVRVVSGSMADSRGSVIQVKPDLNVVRCKLMVFERETTVELQANQIELLSEEELERLKEEDKLRNGDVGSGKGRDERISRGRDRIDATLGSADYDNAGVASSADDLALLLSDDLDEGWDPMADAFSKRKSQSGSKKSAGVGDDVVVDDDDDDDDDGFTSAEEVVDGAEQDGDDGGLSTSDWSPIRGKKDAGNKKGLISSDEELDNLLRGADEGDVFNLSTTAKDDLAGEQRAGGAGKGKKRTSDVRKMQDEFDDLNAVFDNLDDVTSEMERKEVERMKETEVRFAEEDGDEKVSLKIPREQREFDEAYSMDYDPTSLGLDDMGESMIEVEGLEKGPDVDLNDPGPYPDVDYDALVRKEKARKSGVGGTGSGSSQADKKKKRKGSRDNMSQESSSVTGASSS